MYTKSTCSAPVALAIAIALVSAAGSTVAADVERYDYQSAAGACQGALPAFAGTLRARPLAIGNEGVTGAFVTCAQVTDEFNSESRTTNAILGLGNVGTSPVTIKCTFVHGRGGSSVPASYLPLMPMTLDPGQTGFFQIVPENIDPNMSRLRYAQWSCSLPPGAVINYLGRHYVENVGN